MEDWRRTRGQLAVLTRHHPDSDHSDLRRQLREERLAEHIRREVDRAPALTEEQRTRLAALLSPTSTARGDAA